MNDYALFDQLMAASAPAAPYAPYGLDEWGNPLPEPQIPSAIQTTAPVAQQAQRDYTQAITAAFDWTPPAPLPPALPEMQGASYSPVGNAAANLTAQFATPDDMPGSYYVDEQGLNRPADIVGILNQRFGDQGYGAPDYNAVSPAQRQMVADYITRQTQQQTGIGAPSTFDKATGAALNAAGTALGTDVIPGFLGQMLVRGVTGDYLGTGDTLGLEDYLRSKETNGKISVADLYQTADRPSDIAKQQAINLIGDNPYGRIAGEALNIGLAPETLASLGIAGASPLANAIGRGSMKTAPYLTSLVGSQVANDIAREAGAPMPVQLGASVLGAIGGAGIPAAATLGVAGTRVAAQAAARESAARIAAQAAASRRLANILPDSVLTEARVAAINANRAGQDPVAAARLALRRPGSFRIAGAAEPTPEEIEAVAKMIADLNLPEGKTREAVKGLPRAYGTWTPEEDAMIRTLKQMGWDDQAIAAGMGREGAESIAARYQKILLSEGRQPLGLDDVPPVEGYGGGIEDEAARAIRTGGAINVPTGQQNQQAFGDFVQEAAANPQVENPSRLGPLLDAGPSPGGPLAANQPPSVEARIQAAKLGFGGASGERPVQTVTDDFWSGKFWKKPVSTAGDELRQLNAGLDYSYVLRQGKPLSLAHPGAVWAAAKDAVAATVDNDVALALNAEMKASARAKRANLRLSDIDGEGPMLINSREENYSGALTSKLPGYKQTARGNTIYLNRLRLETFNAVVDSWDRTKLAVESGTATPYQKLLSRFARLDDEKALANFINRATGYGTLGKLEGTQIDDFLKFSMFSPRFQASRPQMYMNLLNVKNPLVMKEAWKDIGIDTASTTALLYLADASGVADVNLDPRSSDFGKFKIGDRRIDPWAGAQQLATFAARMATGQYASGVDVNRLELLGKFARSKAAPFPGTAYDLTLGGRKDPLGRDIDAEALASSVFPIWAQGMYEAAQEGLLGQALTTLPASFFGLGTDTYAATPAAQLESAANKLNPAIPWAEMGNAEKDEFVKANPSLKPLYDKQQAAREGPSATLSTLKEAGLAELAPLATKDPQAYRKGAGDLVGDLASQREALMREGVIDKFDSKSELSTKVDEYYKKVGEANAYATDANGNRVRISTDYDMQEKLGADYLASLDPAMRERVIKELAYSKDETYAQLLRDRQTLAPYFDVRDQAWQMVQAAEPGKAQFSTFDAFYRDAVSGFKDAGLNNAEAEAMADKYTKLYADFMATQTKAYLTANEQNFALLKVLDKWGYYVPASLRAYAR